jgi:hypothetical protein
MGMNVPQGATKMDAERLSELAKDVMDLLKKYDIPVEKFTLSILVPREFYQTIKENFPDRHPMDVIIGSGAENWAIDILYSRLAAGEIELPPNE